jgi:hypothetical protein
MERRDRDTLGQLLSPLIFHPAYFPAASSVAVAEMSFSSVDSSQFQTLSDDYSLLASHPDDYSLLASHPDVFPPSYPTLTPTPSPNPQQFPIPSPSTQGYVSDCLPMHQPAQNLPWEAGWGHGKPGLGVGRVCTARHTRHACHAAHCPAAKLAAHGTAA